MSAESENQIILPPSVEEIAPSEKTNASKCCTCEAIINDGDFKLRCTNVKCGKCSCKACVNLMLELMLAQPAFNYPLSCSSCQNVFNLIEIDNIISKEDRYEQFIACTLPLFWSKDCLEKNEKLAQCPFCPYVEIYTTDACPLYFFTCQHPSCRRRSCLICLHDIKDDNDESVHRNRCIELHTYKQMFENAIESGCQQQCPHCQLKGLKDDGCTHMVCERCGLNWCYLCGMKEEECLVDDGAEQTLYAHNQEWESHEGRCPMSLVSIHELDTRWPEDDRDCLEYFHRYRTLCKLYDTFKLIGEDKFNRLNDEFGTIDASGYTIDEIKDYENRILINYTPNESN